MSHKAQSLTLSEDECWRLKRILESKLVPARVQLRAQVLLGAAAGLSNHELAVRFFVSRPTVIKWRKHYVEHGLKDLLLPRAPSRRRSAAGRKEIEIINVSLGSRPGNASRWTIHGLALCERGGEARISTNVTATKRP
jgi:transposase